MIDVPRILRSLGGRAAARGTDTAPPPPRFPGIRQAMDGTGAIVAMETAASDAAGAYPITPSTQMGEGWAAAKARGKTNVFGRRLLFFEPEGEHAAAAVTAGMSMTGLRATNFSSGQGIVYMHESLYPAVGKRLTYVLNMACRAITKQSLNIHAGHDDYHAVDDTGFFQLFAKNAQEAADLNLIAHRIAELSLTPGICAQDGFLTSHVIESLNLPEDDLVREYLGDPADLIDSPTPSQRMVFGERRRRIPEMFDLDYPAVLGPVQNQDSYMQGVAAQRPFYFDHLPALAERAFSEYAALTGRSYAPVQGHRLDDAEWVLVGQGSVVSDAEAVCDYLRDERDLRVGVLNVTMWRPFPAGLVVRMLAGKRGVTVLERTDQPLAGEAPILREIRGAMARAVENGRAERGAEAEGRGSGRRGASAGSAAGRGDARPRKGGPASPGHGKGVPLPVVGSTAGAASGNETPHPGLPVLAEGDVPTFHSAVFGLGSRDLQPGHLVAAVENMLPGGEGRRSYYLGIDFLRPNGGLPKLQIWQEELRDGYPDLARLTLPPAGEVDVMPPGALSVRIHSVGGWGAMTMGKNLAMTAFDLLGMEVKANPRYGSEKKGQPTAFFLTLARAPIRTNGELRNVDVVLSPDPNVFRHSNPLAGLRSGGVFVIQGDQEPDALWAGLPASARREIREKGIAVHLLDGFRIAAEEASSSELRYRMQGAAFMGAFFAASPLAAQEGLDEEPLFEGIRAQLSAHFGHLGERVVEDNLRVIRRGFRELRRVEVPEADGEEEDLTGVVPRIPGTMDVPAAGDGAANPGRFWDQVCGPCLLGQDPLADPFTAVSAVPAATGPLRDMTDVRLEVPDFIAEKCTGCSHCWVQCPDSAIPALVNTVEEVLEAAVATAGNGRPLDRIKQIARPLAGEVRKGLKGVPFRTFGEALSQAYGSVADRLKWDPERRAALDADFARVHAALADYPLAKTPAFYDGPESREKGSGGLLSIMINPEACKGCNLCVEVCEDGALVSKAQTEDDVEVLRRNFELWKHLPDSDDRYVRIASMEEGIGILSSLLLKKQNYLSMVGGDGACMGCGEKTAMHLVVSAIHALMVPRVASHVERLDELIAGLDQAVRELLTSDVDLESALASFEEDRVGLPLDPAKRERLERIAELKRRLEDLRWRYVEGPGGRGRSHLGMTNATGCSSVWGSTYPYNPYPFPWANHLFQDAPSLAIGIFEGHMRKMADGFLAIRRAELEVADRYDPKVHEAEWADFDWRRFSDEEFALCPPIVATGGDGAMLDIGFQNLSRLLSSGKPIRVIVLDTQVYSNTGGQACTSGFTGQVSDMAEFGAAQRGKEEVRKELALIAMAHREVYVHQSSQASATHLLEGVLKGLQKRRPVLFNLYTPCPVEHGTGDDSSMRAARLALESRAFPYLTYDPDAGETLADRLDLEGNPSPDDPWPTYTLKYVDAAGNPSELALPLTTADWAATEGRFRKHFQRIREGENGDDLVPFHEYLALPVGEREGKVPFIHTLGAEAEGPAGASPGRRLERTRVADEIVTLAEERLRHWSLLRQMAGAELAPRVRAGVARELESEFEARVRALEAEHRAGLEELKARYPALVARRMAEGLLRAGDGELTLAQLLERAAAAPPLPSPGGNALPDLPLTGAGSGETADAASPTGGTPDEPAGASGAGAGAGVAGGEGAGPGIAGGASAGSVAPAGPAAGAAPASSGGAPAVAVEEDDEDDDALVLEPYIETERCTSCDECIKINDRMFAYDENKQAYIKDPRAGTFAELVKAAERCTIEIIHPGTPLDPSEKDLEKWVARAERFN
jgi:pyruvate-ferredoxin/flavodoxin oxidoreductase